MRQAVLWTATLVVLAIMWPFDVASATEPKTKPASRPEGTVRYYPWPFKADVASLPRGFGGNNLRTLFDVRKLLEREKGEFETTAQFEARLPAVGDSLYAFRVEATDIVGHPISYDADSESLTIRFKPRAVHWPESARFEVLMRRRAPLEVMLREASQGKRSGKELARGAGHVVYIRNWQDWFPDEWEPRLAIGVPAATAKAVKEESAVLLVCRLARFPERGVTWMEYEYGGSHQGVLVDVLEVWWYRPTSGMVIEKQLVGR